MDIEKMDKIKPKTTNKHEILERVFKAKAGKDSQYRIIFMLKSVKLYLEESENSKKDHWIKFTQLAESALGISKVTTLVLVITKLILSLNLQITWSKYKSNPAQPNPILPTSQSPNIPSPPHTRSTSQTIIKIIFTPLPPPNSPSTQLLLFTQEP
jgi:hypothetical protein